MSFKDVVKDTIKIGGCMGALVISGGIVTLKAYRQGYLHACNHTAKTEEKVREE